MKYISLTQGKFAIVDDEDYKELSKHKWYAMKNGTRYYALRKVNGKKILMHRVIMTPPRHLQVDHINHNGLDNRRANLRLCTARQQTWNSFPRKNTSSKFKGVHWNKCSMKWQVQIWKNGKPKHLGLYDNETEAAKVYDREATGLFGEYAYLNFGNVMYYEDEIF